VPQVDREPPHGGDDHVSGGALGRTLERSLYSGSVGSKAVRAESMSAATVGRVAASSRSSGIGLLGGRTSGDQRRREQRERRTDEGVRHESPPLPTVSTELGAP